MCIITYTFESLLRSRSYHLWVGIISTFRLSNLSHKGQKQHRILQHYTTQIWRCSCCIKHKRLELIHDRASSAKINSKCKNKRNNIKFHPSHPSSHLQPVYYIQKYGTPSCPKPTHRPRTTGSLMPKNSCTLMKPDPEVLMRWNTSGRPLLIAGSHPVKRKTPKTTPWLHRAFLNSRNQPMGFFQIQIPIKSGDLDRHVDRSENLDSV